MDAGILSQSFAPIADAPGGMQQLRDTILQLAVMGKLVPQIPAEGTGEELLERIKAETSAQINSGIIRPRKPTPSLKQNELPFPVPASWTWARLQLLGDVKPRNDLPDDLDASFVPMALLSEKYGEQPRSEKRAWKEIKTGFTHFADGDVVMAKITPCFQNRKSAVMRGLCNSVGAGTTELHVFRPVSETMISDYIAIFLKSPEFIEQGVRRMTGSAGQKRVPHDYFALSPVPVPPRAEQERIVEKVAELMSLCDDLEARQQQRREVRIHLNDAALERLVTASDPAEFAAAWRRVRDNFDLLYAVPENVAKLRQAILQLAVQGKLGTADKLDISFSGGDGVAGWFPRPKDWRWVTVPEVAEHRLGKMLDKHKNKGTALPYLRNTNVQWFRFDLTSLKSMRFRDDESEEYALRAGDVLICEGGHAGRTAVWTEQESPMRFQKALHRVRPTAALNSHYFAFCMKAYHDSGILQRYFTGSGIPHLTGRSLVKIAFPLPPRPEQDRIVEIVVIYLGLCDELEWKLLAKRAHADRLAQAVVNAVVNGKMPDAKQLQADPHDDPLCP
jgi:type I restriction enzyme S subunit